MMKCHIQIPVVSKPKTEIHFIPGDKSISHRAVMVGALAENESAFHNFLSSEDCLHTATLFQSLGVPISVSSKKKTIQIQGVGLRGLKPPSKSLDVGNAGTAIRLMAGVLAGQPFSSTLTGDASIQNRPMKRVISPLRDMGAVIEGLIKEGKTDIYPPLKINGATRPLRPLEYTLPVASAQVKSALLFASLYGSDISKIKEPEPTRDHTERMLKSFGADIHFSGNTILCSGKNPLRNPYNNPIYIPSDISSAAFFIVLGLLTPHTEWLIKGVGLNPSRIQLLHTLRDMGADIQIMDARTSYFEPYGDILVKTSQLRNISIPPKDIPFLIDEIPILSVAALFGRGKFHLNGAKELRVKESDRIRTIAHIARQMGGKITEFEDGFELTGPLSFQNFEADSHGDHRIAMAAIIGALGAGREAIVTDCDCIQTSFPNFFEILEELYQKPFITS